MSDSTLMPRRPGGRMASRPLHFIWLADGSGSMRVDGKIQALNHAIREAIPHMRNAARENPHAAVYVNAIRFGDEARWMGEKLTPVSEFRWQDVEAGGVTALGEALTMVGDVLQPPLMTDRALPPVIALVTDGLPTDDFQAGLNHLLSKPWGKQAVRIVVGIGEDSTSPEAQEIFRAFIANEALHPFQANNPEVLVEAIRWVSTAVLKSASSPVGQVAESAVAALAAGNDHAAAQMMGVEVPLQDEADVMVRGLPWTALGASVRGASHETTGQKNQDSARLKNPVGGDDFLLLAVSDGHGSTRSFRSDRGSALAAECALSVARDFVRRLGPSASLSRVRRHAQARWPQAVVAAWRSAVRADLNADPFSPLDFAAFPEPAPVIKPDEDLPGSAYLAYGATLVAVAITRRYILYAQLGDGDILTVQGDGSVRRPLPRMHEFMANQTASLCTGRAVSLFQIKVEPCRGDGPALITISSDGYANCFGNDEGFFKVGADLLAYLRSEGIPFVGENLEHWLRESSQNGSGDDITVGLAVRTGTS